MPTNLLIQPKPAHLSEAEQILAAEVEDLKQIHRLSVRLADADSLTDVLMDVLRTAARLVGARLGSAQLVSSDGKLRMVGQIGFGDGVLETFATVSLDDCSTCAVALKRRARVIVSDLRNDHDFTQIAAALCSYGAVGAVSTPVLDKAGNVLAMFSLYWLDQHVPDDRELEALDLCAELAGRHVERSIAARALIDQDKRQTLLMRELAHRGKNLLSVIQAIATRSLNGGRTLDEARDVFIGRLGALANTYHTLTEHSPVSVPLNEIVNAGLRYYSERVDVSGPPVSIPAKKAQILALVVHELATNAAKYGALANSTGRVEVSWEICEGRFLFTWAEVGGSAAVAPQKTGFGSTIITSVVRDELSCLPNLDYRRDGFRYHLEASLNDLADMSV